MNKSVKATGTHKRLKYNTKRGTNNEAPKIIRETCEFEPHFSFPHEREPQQCQRVVTARTWSTTAVKSLKFTSFTSGFKINFR